MAATNLPTETIRQWLALKSPSLLAHHLTTTRHVISLPQATCLSRHLRSLSADLPRLKLGVLHTYTSEPLEPWLNFESTVHGFAVSTFHAPYGFLHQEAQPGSRLSLYEPDLTLLMLQRDDLDPSLTQTLIQASSEELPGIADRTISSFTNLIRKLRSATAGLIIITLLPRLYPVGLGLYDANSNRSEAYLWSAFKERLTSSIRAADSGVFFVDLDLALEVIGRTNYFDLRFWYTARFPFSTVAARDLAHRICRVATALIRPKAKVLVLDADNTLWGGVVGEVGVAGVQLGHEYPGNCYRDFQKRLLEYKNRGFLLCLCSKNNPEDVAELLRDHPQQLLRESHFAASRVNWLAKTDNLIDIATELNLGLESFVFVDDSEYECGAVQRRLPQVTVVQVPSKPIDIPTCLDHLARLEILALTQEDLERTSLYANERQRKALASSVRDSGGDLDDYLRSLEMKMDIGIDDITQIPRIAQLTAKTNQFNLTTRRHEAGALQGFVESDRYLVAHFSISDIFGDSGVVGVAIIRRMEAATVEIDTLLMSCRIIGRRAETVFLETLLAMLANEGYRDVIADFFPTKKNGLVSDFLTQHQFQQRPDGRFLRNLEAAPPTPTRNFPFVVNVAL